MAVRTRRADPTPVGHLYLVLGRDGCTYARWTPQEQAVADLGRLATVAAVDWAVRATLAHHAGGDSSVPKWGTRAVRHYLERLCSSATATVHGKRVGAGEVYLSAPPPGTIGPSVRLDVAMREEGRLALQWSVPSECRSVAGAERTLAGLWMLAEQHGQGGVVHHALYALRGGFERSGPFPTEVADDLVASLLLFGADMHATDVRAQQSRSRLRLL